MGIAEYQKAPLYIRGELKKVRPGVPVVLAVHLCLDAITNRNELIEAIDKSNVILVLGGHYHQATVQKYRGVNFVQLPSPTSPWQCVSSWRSPSKPSQIADPSQL